MNRRPWVTCLLALASTGAMALPTTYVATFGTDANPCSLPAPCRSFAGALPKTDVDGTIVVLDSGGFGQVQVNKSVSMVAPDGVYAGISVLSGTGISIVAPASRVSLSGLTVVGLGGTTGISASAAAYLSIDRTTITGFAQSAIDLCCQPGKALLRDAALDSNGEGLNASQWTIVLERTRVLDQNFGGIGVGNGARVTVVDSTFAWNTLYALDVQTSGGASALVRRSVFSDGNGAIAISGMPSTGGSLSVDHSLFARNQVGVNAGTGISAGVPLLVDVTRSVFMDNQTAIVASDSFAKLTLTRNAIAGNASGVANLFGSVIQSRGDNVIRNNTTDGGPFTPLPGV